MTGRIHDLLTSSPRSGRPPSRRSSGTGVSTPHAAFRIWRNRPYLFFLTAVIVADVAVISIGLRTTSFHRSLEERGRIASARVTRHEIRPSIRGPDNEFFFYTYEDASGSRHEGSTCTRTLVVGGTVPVTYLLDAPADHVLFPMTRERIDQPLRAAGRFAVASLGVTLLMGAVVQWAMARREV